VDVSNPIINETHSFKSENQEQKMQKYPFIFISLMCATWFIPGLFANNSIQLQSGLNSFQVFQRNEQNTAPIEFAGICAPGSGRVEVRIQNFRHVLPGFDWKPVGAFQQNKFSGKIDALPVGGPYVIQIRLISSAGKISATTSVSNILVGDLWILAGQSNMQGIGDLQIENTPSVYIHSFGYNETWAIATDPLHWLLDSVDPVHRYGLTGTQLEVARKQAREDAVTGTGCGLPFAQEMVAATGVPIGLVPCAHGGTSMAEWDPARRDEGGASLYGSMYRRFKEVGGKVTGVLWYQGESDASTTSVPLFRDRLIQLVAAMRKDFNHPSLPFYQVQIGRYVVPFQNPAWKEIQTLQTQCAGEIERCETVASIDLELDDPIHVSTGGLQRLGRRLATLALRDLFGYAEYQPGPQFEAFEPVPFRQPRYRVNFTGINGALQSAARPTGFSFRDSTGQDLNLIFKTAITADGQAIDLFLTNHPPTNAFLWYGYGLNPYCNVVDELDMALPVFGPVPMTEIRYWNLLEQWQVSEGNLSEYVPFLGALVARYPERRAEMQETFQQKLNTLTPAEKLALSPVLFSLGDFSLWPDWLKTAETASLAERKKMAAIFAQLPGTASLKSGFIRNWLVVGPYDYANDAGYDRVYAPERNQKLLLSAPDQALDSLKWLPATSNANGYLDFMPLFEPNQNTLAYALAVVEATQKVKVPLLLGSDDAAVVWVNGQEIHREHMHRGARPASDLMLIELNPGKNSILVKVDQGAGDWGLFLQLVDKAGAVKF
jgi:sialate O-acetylesterase